MDGMIDQLMNALVFGGRDGNDRHTEQALHSVDIDAAPVLCHLIHHVQGDNHGPVHLQKLHGQIHIPLNVGGIYDIDDSPGLLIEDKIPGDKFLAAVGGHGIDPGEVRNYGIGMAFDDAVLPVYRHPGEVPHMLVGPGQLIEEGSLSAVLVSYQGKGQSGPFRERVSAALGVELSSLAKTRVRHCQALPFCLPFLAGL